jgi:hypothetical protein
MGGALLYLAVCSIRNRLRVRLRRLREPRYLVGLGVGLAYLALVLWRYGVSLTSERAARGPRPGPRPAGVDVAGALELVGAVGLFVFTVLAWVLPGTGRPALTFSRADAHWLFTAPVSRRQVLHYKILRSQAGVLAGSAIAALVFRRPGPAGIWTFFVGMSMVMATVNLHMTGISLRRDSLRAHGSAGVKRQWLPLAVVAAAVGILAATVGADWSTFASAPGPAELFGEIQRTSRAWPAWIVLLPFTVLMRLPFSASVPEFLAVLPFGLAILAANYLWVLRSDVAFEDAAARDARRHAGPRERAQRPDPVRRRAPFRLSPIGRPETALMWKNLVLAGRYATWSAVLRVLPLILLGGFVAGQAARSLADTLAVLCVIGAVGTMLVGPQIARNDLRQDLLHLATLKTWPLGGAAIARGEVLGPTVLLSAIVWLLSIGAMAFADGGTFGAGLSGAQRASYLAALMMVAPGVILVQVVVQNGLAVMFPAWIDLGSSRTRGMEVMGHRLLVAGVLLVTVGVALVPALVAAAIAGWALFVATGVPAVLPGALAALGVLGVEAALALEAIGRAIDRMDVAAVPVEE